MAKFWGSTHRCPVAAVRSRVGGLQGHSRHRRRGSRSNRDGMTTAGGQLVKGGPQKSIGFQSGIRAEGRNLPQFPTKANPGKASLLRSDKGCSGLSSTTFQVWSTCSALRSPLPTQIIRGRAKEGASSHGPNLREPTKALSSHAPSALKGYPGPSLQQEAARRLPRLPH